MRHLTFRLRASLFALSLALCAPLAGAQSAQAGRYYEDALKRYGAKDYAGAEIQLKNALQADRSLLPAHLLLGKVALANSDFNQAQVALNEAMRLGANRSEVAVPLAQAMVQLGQHHAMLVDVRLDPSGLPTAAAVQLLLVRARALSEVGDDPRAFAEIEKARTLQPDSAQVWAAEASARQHARQFPQALKALDRALSLGPRDPQILLLKANLAHSQNQLDAALAGYEAVLQVEPKHLEARLSRAGLLLDLKKADTLPAEVETLQQIAPQDPRVVYLAAMVAEQRGDREGSRKALRGVTELIDPVPFDLIRFRPQILMLGGLAHYSLGEPTNARPFLEAVAKQNPRSPATKLLAQIMFDDHQVENGIALLEGYLRLNPLDAQAVALLAAGHSTQGRHAKALSLVQEALKLRDTGELRSMQGLSLLRAGQLTEAQTVLEAAYKQSAGATGPGFPLVMLYLRSQQFAKAEQLVQSLLQQRPRDATYLHLLGMAKAGRGDLAGARLAYVDALKQEPALVSAHISLARIDLRQGKSGAALERLKAQNQIDTNNIDVMLELAQVYRSRQEWDDAQRWLESATALAPARELRPDLALVELLMLRNQTDAALKVANGLVAKAPEELAAMVTLARVQLVKRDMAAARPVLVRASRRAAFETEPLVEIAGLQLRAGDAPNARYSLEKALQTLPNHVPALVLSSTALLAQNQVADAQKTAERVVALAPKAAAGHLLLADVATVQRQPEKVLQQLKLAHEIEPSASTAMRLFLHLAATDAGTAAARFAETWLKGHPKDLALQKALGDHFASRQNFSGAQGAYQRALQLQRDDVGVMNNLANVQLQLKDYAGALQTIAKARELAPGRAEVIDSQAWILHHQGKHEQALVLLRDARLRLPENSEVRFHLATVLAKLGKTEEARTELKAALASPQSLESTKAAQSLLQTLK